MTGFRAAAIKPTVSLDDLSKLDIRVGTIQSIDDVAGVLSEGMLLDSGYADGITPVLALPEKPVPDGARVG